LKLLQNRFENAVNIAQNVVVPKPNDVIPPFLQDARAFCILSSAHVVLATIDLNDDFQVERDEIDDVVRDRRLPFELDAFKPAAAQSGPQEFFGFGRAFAERAGEFTRRPSPLTLPSPRWGEGFRLNPAQRLRTCHISSGFC
jgi:hypothetical protein